ncbi:hypothetical protein EVAR_51345_1 [Eumeta japonica]|uniref:Uncharacterized protein n=1 Tax=Eumeta variegata TaxID=151549 RepID=A0A4C1XVY7_EUMVA|nr:hypothetical protein EVAR_51345_1 [Eumeta japonica]
MNNKSEGKPEVRYSEVGSSLGFEPKQWRDCAGGGRRRPVTLFTGASAQRANVSDAPGVVDRLSSGRDLRRRLHADTDKGEGDRWLRYRRARLKLNDDYRRRRARPRRAAGGGRTRCRFHRTRWSRAHYPLSAPSDCRRRSSTVTRRRHAADSRTAAAVTPTTAHSERLEFWIIAGSRLRL